MAFLLKGQFVIKGYQLIRVSYFALFDPPPINFFYVFYAFKDFKLHDFELGNDCQVLFEWALRTNI